MAPLSFQAVYFSSSTHRADAETLAERTPNLWRLADTAPNRKAGGLLSQVSREAALNTDVYIFRESTGELIVEVSGLPQAGERRIVDNGRAYTWDTVMRGPRTQIYTGGALTVGSDYTTQSQGLDAFQRDIGYTARFAERNSGIPGPGESLRLVAINRTTGYTGTATLTLGNPGQNGSAAGSINQAVPDITLTPPNLKVWARRLSSIEQGLTQGETVNYLIGHEGAATRNDTLVAIYTEWLDEHDKPLPEGLGLQQGKDFGLSGRLAKLTGTGLAAVSAGTAVNPDNLDIDAVAQGNSVVEFPVKPGRAIQLLRFKADHLSNEHYYVNVFGRALNKEACPHCEYTKTTAHQNALAQRPNHYTPIRVPQYDEATTRALQQERDRLRREGNTEELGKVEPQYQWPHRPEYQFSLVELTINQIQAIHEDSEGNEITRNLLDGSTLPIISKHDELIRAFYDLTLPQIPPLPGFDGPREYILAFGEEEMPITIGSQGVEFSNLEQLSQLASLSTASDLLTIRVFLNHDPGNLLWEWAFVKNGLRIEFEYPGDKVVLKPQKNPVNPLDPEGYFLLGGARIKLGYDFPPDSTPLYLRISLNQPGRLCTSFYQPAVDCTTAEVDTPLAGGWASDTGAGTRIAENWHVWWEPNDWANTLDAGLTVEAGYLVGESLVQLSFNPLPVEAVKPGILPVTSNPLHTWLRNRTLSPTAQPQQQGSDVAILEAILWQLGLSPQRGSDYREKSNAGAEAARIDSQRGSNRWTHNCQSTIADNRTIFYKGWNTCAAGLVSLEGMIKRFYGRNNTNNDGIDFDAHYAGVTAASGVVDTALLGHLYDVWQEYIKAYAGSYKVNGIEYFYANNPVTGFASVHINQWIDDALDIWETGNTAANIVPTYTEAEHTGMLEDAGYSGNTALTRRGLLRAWKAQEAPYHWGMNVKGYQSTPFRITEGAADEFGSLGFSQIKYAYRYGHANVRCDALSQFNLYDPVGSIKAMLAFVAASPNHGNRNCKKSFYYGFAESGAWRTLVSPQASLRGYRDRQGTVHAMAANRTDDAYERLMKSLAGYNGSDNLDVHTWAHLLRTKHTTKMGMLASNRKYAMEIRQRYGMEGRTYIWYGGTNPLVTTNAQGQQVPHPQAGQGWCFEYGENEWMNPFVTETPLRDRNNNIVRDDQNNIVYKVAEFGNYRDRARGDMGVPSVGRVNCLSGVAMP